MYAEVVVNIEAPLEGTFHYHVPRDLEAQLQLGQLVEVEFGRRLAQAIVVAFSPAAPVAETKPVIAVIEAQPVIRPAQLELARWLSHEYLTALNACLRLFLPPGLTRWSDVLYDLNPAWEGDGRLTATQASIVELLRQKGALRPRQIGHALPKVDDWQKAAEQLVRRGILRRASILDRPRARPKVARTAELIAGRAQILAAAPHLGRASQAAAALYYLATEPDMLPPEDEIMAAAGVSQKTLAELAAAGLIQRAPAESLVIQGPRRAEAPPEAAEFLASLPVRPEDAPDQALLNRLAGAGVVEVVAEPAAAGLALGEWAAAAEIYRLRKAERYFAVLAELAKAASPLPVGQIYAATEATLSQLRKMAKLGLIRLGEEEVWRDPLADQDFVPAEPPRLTADQAAVWQAVQAAMSRDEPEPFLLHGVTGSGKTEIYIRAVALALQRGRRAIVMVPEIALTPQTIRRFAARFPGQVAVLHSRLTEGERYDTWRRAWQDGFDIAIGPRSALFAPLDNLGVIVVDEEHDSSYKQDPPVAPPYYHGRDAALELGRLTGALVILGSATPDLVSYHRAQTGAYRLLELPRRIMGHRQRITAQAGRLGRESRYQPLADEPEEALTIPLPPVQVVDLRHELRAGNRSIFSRPLQQAMDETLARGEQAILFLNRRGSASSVVCRDCGHVLRCKRCETALTYHRPGQALVCHFCGRREPPPESCPNCGSGRIRYLGLGTEEVERQVRAGWPAARVLRWDRDTTAGRDSHEALLASFIQGKADVLVGTQMIAKGLDLPLVTLVGVISADVALGLPDFRMAERTFQLLAQVAGRAGRGLLGGRVIIQSYRPEHYAIQAAAEHDYTSFYLEEIRFRTVHRLPPFQRLTRLIYADPAAERAERGALELAEALREHIQAAGSRAELIGPAPPFFQRLDSRYRWQILVRAGDPAGLLADFPLPAGWIVDVDPVSLL
ncbi:MAG: replication restart helicase PriA [Candidatus Promineifilaceae bacterium]